MKRSIEKTAAVRTMLGINDRDFRIIKKFFFARRVAIQYAIGHEEIRTVVMDKEVFHKKKELLI